MALARQAWRTSCSGAAREYLSRNSQRIPPSPPSPLSPSCMRVTNKARFVRYFATNQYRKTEDPPTSTSCLHVAVAKTLNPCPNPMDVGWAAKALDSLDFRHKMLMLQHRQRVRT
jgi:hypothetical protein